MARKKTTDTVVPKGQEDVLDARKMAFLEFYYNPRSETFANAYQSALAAGFSESYARLIKSPAIKNQWIRINNRVNMEPEHIIAGIERMAMSANRDSDKLRALELLAKMKGLLVDRSITAHVNIEQAIQELK